MAQVGEFSFVLAAVGREEGIIQEFAYQVTVGLIAITLLLSPLVVWGAGRLVGAGGRPPTETGRAEPGCA